MFGGYKPQINSLKQENIRLTTENQVMQDEYQGIKTENEELLNKLNELGDLENQ